MLAITTAPESEIALPLEIRKAPDSVIFVWPVYELEPVRVKKRTSLHGDRTRAGCNTGVDGNRAICSKGSDLNL